MIPEIQETKDKFHKELDVASSSQAIEEVRVRFLGRKGPVQSLMGLLKKASKEERPFIGKEINTLKEHIEKEIYQKEATLFAKELEARLQQEKIDVTLPGRKNACGKKHPLSQALDRMLDILVGMGFSVQYGPDIDTDYYNYEVLNFPKDHPARDEMDTYYISGDVLLRSHTSNVQARVMEKEALPIRVVAPGKCYRNETITARSHVQFHQIEGFYIDKGVTFQDLISTLDQFIKKLFGNEVKVRFRASYFPFVEPGMEVDVSCLLCQGTGCSVCKHTGWLEVLGAGMIHPEVLKNIGIDPEKHSGYAWGMGVERLVMIEKGIKDIRWFFENDLRFLEQF